MKNCGDRRPRNTLKRSRQKKKGPVRRKKKKKKTTYLAQNRNFQKFITFFLDGILTNGKNLRLDLDQMYTIKITGRQKCLLQLSYEGRKIGTLPFSCCRVIQCNSASAVSYFWGGDRCCGRTIRYNFFENQNFLKSHNGI